MTKRPIGPVARWLEDFTPGQVYLTQGRTITDVDASVWAMFTGDMHPLHVDDVAAGTHGLFGGRFPPGLMFVAVASGLWERLGLLHGSGLYVDEITIKYHVPMLVGVTIRMRAEVAAVEREDGRDRGLVRFHYAILDADESSCVTGALAVGVACRPDDALPTTGLVSSGEQP